MSRENPDSGSEQEKPKEIKDAESFPELFEILEAKKEIIGSGGRKFDTKDMVDKINIMRAIVYDDLDNPLYSMEYYDNYIHENKKSFTRAEGLRDKIFKLLRKDIESKFKHRENIGKN